MANKSFVFRFDDVEVREREFRLSSGQVLAVEPKASAPSCSCSTIRKTDLEGKLLNGVWAMQPLPRAP